MPKRQSKPPPQWKAESHATPQPQQQWKTPPQPTDVPPQWKAKAKSHATPQWKAEPQADLSQGDGPAAWPKISAAPPKSGLPPASNAFVVLRKPDDTGESSRPPLLEALGAAAKAPSMDTSVRKGPCSRVQT